MCHLQSLAQKVALCTTCLSHLIQNFNRGNSLLLGLWYWSSFANGSWNTISKGIERNRVVGLSMGPKSIWLVKLNRRESTKGYLSWSLVAKKDGKSIKKKCLRVFEKGDLVLKRIPIHVNDLHGEWPPNWEGLYVVKTTFLWGALILA